MIAAVKVVFPCSTFPIVPTFTFGLLQERTLLLNQAPTNSKIQSNSLSSGCGHRSPQRSSETQRRREIIRSNERSTEKETERDLSGREEA